MDNEFYDRWMGRQVVIRFGPFVGRHGQVCGIGSERIRVVFPELTISLFGTEQQREWFVMDDVEIRVREELERGEQSRMTGSAT